MKNIRLLSILVLIFTCICGYAQTIAVESFVLAETDLTANTPGTMVHDQNGNLCALIKIETTQKGFTFDVGVLGVVSTVERTAEIWVYVPYGIRKITIQHPQLGTLRDYQIPCPVEKGRTYIMKLAAGSVRTIVEYAQTKQFLYIELNPADATLEINGKLKVTDNGVYQELLPYGRYQYKAYYPNYHDLNGIVEVNDQKQSLNLKLKAAFGHLSILDNSNADYSGASVYIDDKPVGKIPVRDLVVSSGSHKIRIMKELYEPFTQTFLISDEENRQMVPDMVPDFAEVTLSTGSGASIYINGELKGKTMWKGRLASGSYVLESRQDGHVPYKMSYDITRHDHAKTIHIQSPTPIYGSLVVSSNPPKAKVYVGSEYVGDTPLYVPRQIIGQHTVSVKADGYKTESRQVQVAEGAEASLSFTLEKYDDVSFSSGNGTQHQATGQTANCYIITRAGSYSFPAVKGNSSTSVGAVSSAVVLWESFGTSVKPNVGDLIGSVSYEDGKITFSTASVFREGNAVIAAKDSRGNILWSWHIWLTDQPKEQVYYNNAGTMMDRNLGATSATPGDVEALGLLYQWGRKDPFLNIGSYSYSTIAAESTISWPEPVSSGRNTGTIGYATAHPTTFITADEKNKDWYYTGSSSAENTRWTTNANPKSIYDPCPAGWRIPDAEPDGVWEIAAGKKESSFSHYVYEKQGTKLGMNMSKTLGRDTEIWYPFAGSLGYDDGFRFLGTSGFYWSASIYPYEWSDSNNRAMQFTINNYENGTVYPSNSEERAAGGSVRCIKDGTEASTASYAQSSGNSSDTTPKQYTGSGNTANCYIITKAGSYSFPAVKGNSSTSVGAVSSAVVLWESFGTSVKPYVGNLIRSVSYQNGKITFSTASVFREGNAVIAAKDSRGNILWSWHIWLTDQPKEQVYYNNAGTMMDRNLGATSATPGDVGALGLHYQWGRKDPFLGSSSISDNVTAESTITWPSRVKCSPSNGTIEYTISHPTTFIWNDADNYDWYYTGNNDSDNTRWTASDKKKSIYDPCPAGWRVPDGYDEGVWAKASGKDAEFSHKYDSSNEGMDFSRKFGNAQTIWYPAAGMIDDSDGRHILTGSWGRYLSVYPREDGFYGVPAFRIIESDSECHPANLTRRSEGGSVRCIKE